jgi:SPP1 gp7 family putative phage head morphogenesis protein
MKQTYFTDRLVQSLKAEVRKGKKRKPMPRRLKARTWKYPYALEMEYQKGLAGYFNEVFSGWLDRAKVELSSVYRQDADQIDSLMDDLFIRQKELADNGGRGNFLGGIFGLGEKVNGFNQAEWAEFSKIAIGEAFIPDEPWVKATLTSWADTQKDLIKSVTGTAQESLLKIMREGVQKGLIYSEVMKKLQVSIDGLSRKKAKLLARDQIGKLNGALAQARQEQAGVDAYTWETVGDERVRGNPSGLYPLAIPSHWAIDGKICRWDNKGVYRDADGNWVPRTALMPKAHPGEEIQCRCVGLPYFDDLWNQAAGQANILPTSPGQIPTAEEALAKIASYPATKGTIPVNTFTTLQAGPDVFANSPIPIDNALFKKYGKKVQPYIGTLTATQDSIKLVDLKFMFYKGQTIPTSPVKVVKYNGAKYIYGTPSHNKVSALQVLGDDRVEAVLVDLDEIIAKDAKLQAKLLSKPTPPPVAAPSQPVKLPGTVEIDSTDTKAIEQALKEGKTVKLTSGGKVVGTSKLVTPPATPVAPIPVAPVIPPAPIIKALDPDALVTKLESTMGGKSLALEKLGLKVEQYGWDAELSNNGVVASSLPSKMGDVPLSDIVMSAGTPEYGWVESYLKDGLKAGSNAPKAVYINGKFHVISGSFQVAGEVVKGSKVMQMSVVDATTAIAEAKAKSALLAAEEAKQLAEALKGGITQKAAILKDQGTYKAMLEGRAKAIRAKHENPAKKAPMLKRDAFKEYNSIPGDSQANYKQAVQVYDADIRASWKKGTITKATLRALAKYKSNNYLEWNAMLRAERRMTDEYAEATANLDIFFDHHRLKEDMVLYRGVKNMPSHVNAQLVPGNEGKLFFDDGFISTATAQAFSETWVKGRTDPFVFRYYAKKGARLAPLLESDPDHYSGTSAYNVGEKEFAGGRNQVSRIVKVYPKGKRPDGTPAPDSNMTYVDMELLNL